MRQCPRCEGFGNAGHWVRFAGAPVHLTMPCPVCNGRGWCSHIEEKRYARFLREDQRAYARAQRGPV